jgi:CheY-like chemotaxis protein/signal transduction histidine kinase
MRLRLSIISKLTILLVGAVVLTALAVNEVYVQGSHRILTQRAIHDLQEEARFFRYPLEDVIKQLKADAQLLAQVPATLALRDAHLNGGIDPQENATEQQWANRLTAIFSATLRTREHYRRIRFIGREDEGKEILRVERFGNLVERMPESKLRKSGNDPLFQAAIQLAPGEVYLSELGLERDDGELIRPHTLVLRAAVGIYTPGKEPFGIISINLNFGAVLQEVKQSLAGSHEVFIVSSEGDYLAHPDKSKLFATDLSHDYRIQRDQPQLLPVMTSLRQNEATLLPEDTAKGNALSFMKYHYDRLNQSKFFGIAVQAPYSETIAKVSEVQRQGFIFSSMIALIAGCAGILLLRFLIRPLNRVADAVVRYRKGEKDLTLPSDSPDEIGVLAREFAAMIKQKGEEEWIKENLVAISRGLLGFKELSGFANSLMEVLTPLVGAQVGVLYISSAFSRRHADGGTETLTLLGAWGYKQQAEETLPRQFKWGEGVVGSCARSRTEMLVADIPDGYLSIATGLGDTRPRQLLLFPVLFENTLVGVLELATLSAFSDIQLTLLKQLSFNIGVIVNSISAGMRTQELLEVTRQTAEELQRNEEELKTQQEELEASNEEMEEKTKALEEQNARIRRQSSELEDTKRVIEAKARELELSNRYKSEFLANMSHELRTPLNSLLILARGLSLNEDGNLTDEQVEEARVIHSGGLELLSLINDILDLSKVEAGKITLAPEDVHIRYVAKKLAQQFQPIAQDSGVVFDIKVEESLPAAVHTDTQRLEQILKNLLSNAFKFTTKGSVTLDIHRVRDGGPKRLTSNGSAAIAFSVIDTGIGIDQGKLEDIFEAFQQEDGSTDRHYGGTGLGLTIARKFAQLLGGEIRVASEKGKGSSFTLFLPLTPAAAASPQHAAQAAISAAFAPKAEDAPGPVPELSKATVKVFIPDDRSLIGPNDNVLLIIEDDPDFGATLMKIARKRGYKCLVAGDGKSGLLLAVERSVTAILLDLRLPDIDGLRVLDQLKHDLATRHIPVHIISGMEAPDSIAPLRKGAIGYLMKPVQQEDLDGVFGQIEAVLRSSLKRVLVVEDDRNTQTAIQSLLRSKQVEIVNASSGAAALAQMQAARFDCIILDLKLPDMTGFDWLEAVEKEGGPETPPIIVYTAKELTEEENRALNRYTGSIVIKGASSSERLLDEVTLFLHSLEATLSQDQQAMIRMQHDPDQALRDRTVLLVDDDLRNTFALSKLLKKRGMNVVIADNGQMALEKLREEKAIELVIMDIMMPIMDGYQAMREIRASGSWRRLPIIALTARAMPEEQERCIEAGANDYLVKPVDIERLLTLLRVWLFKQERAA